MPETQAVIKLELNPDVETEKILDKQSKIANWTYNHLLEQANNLRKEYKENPSEEIRKILYSKRGLRNELPKLKKEKPFLKTVHSSPLKNSALRVSEAIREYQKSRKGERKGKATGWPSFRSWKEKWFSLFYDEPGKGYSVEEGNLHLSLGTGEDKKRKKIIIPIKEADKLAGHNIRNLRIVKQAGVFSAVFTIIREIPEKKPITSLGGSSFFVNSFSNQAEFIKKLTNAERPIDKYLFARLSPQLQTNLLSCNDSAQENKPLSLVCDELNQILETDDFYKKAELFADIELSRQTQRMICQDPQGRNLVALKRKLLEDAYPQEINQNELIVAFDPNHKNFAYGVDVDGKAIEIAAPKWLKTYDKRIDELKAKRDKCKKRSKQIEILDQQGNPTGKKVWLPSRRWKKYNQKLERLYKKRQDQTKTFLFTLANFLCKFYYFVIVGDYTPNGGGLSTGMRRAMNNRSLIGRFKLVLYWVAEKSGRIYDSFKEKGTTRTCCECGYVVKEGIPPDVREWTCSQCHFQHIRDENAARNGLANYLRELEKNGELALSVPGSGLVSVRERWAWCVQTRGVASVILRGEDCGSTTRSK